MFGVCVGGIFVAAGLAVLLHDCRGRHRFALGCAMHHLRATADQKAQTRALFERSRGRLQHLRNKRQSLMMGISDALEQPSLEPAKLEGLETSLFETVGEFSQVVRETLTELHRILDANQRRKLSQWLRRHSACHHHSAC